MLKKILSISGKSGLYKLISQGKNMFIAESFINGKRIPVYPRDKVVSLADIAIYTDDEEVPLREVFLKIKEKEKGEKIILDSLDKPEDLRNYLAEILPSFDRDRVYPSDIKKLVTWYNLLINEGLDQFEEEDEKTEETEEEEENEGFE